MNRVLILDQSKSMRKTLCERLEFEGFYTDGAADIPSAIDIYTGKQFDIILSDSSLGILPEIMRRTPFVVISSDPTIDSALEASRYGAVDFLTKPIDMNRLLKLLRNSCSSPHEDKPLCSNSNIDSYTNLHPNSSSTLTHSHSKRKNSTNSYVEPMIGTSKPMEKLNSLIEKVAPSDARVLIIGENGTGKELVAKYLHHKSNRANAPFVEINCAAIPSELIESELFGHEKGAFTSAIKQRKGKFEQADGGTLFMDEIGDMSLAAQAKVLRVLQERKVCRVGSDRDIDINVRVIAATNKNIKEEIAKGNFREDLYHRLGVIVLKIPPLRERSEDISLLVDYFLTRACEEFHVDLKSIDNAALKLLTSMPWSGNIRELRNVVERLVILGGNPITERDVKDNSL